MRSLTADSGELDILSGVLADVCKHRHLSDIRDRDECARHLLALFSTGITSRDALLGAMRVAIERRPDVLDSIASGPAEADMFKRVYHMHCEIYGIKDEAERAEIARRISVLAFVGIREEERLLRGLVANRDEATRSAYNRRMKSISRHAKVSEHGR